MMVVRHESVMHKDNVEHPVQPDTDTVAYLIVYHHSWVASWDDVNCTDCLREREDTE